MFSANRRNFLAASAALALAACGGGGDSDGPKMPPPTHGNLESPVFGFNLYDYLGNLIADPTNQSMHYLGAFAYNRQQSGFSVFRITSNSGVPLVFFDITPGDGHWYRLHYLVSVGGGVYEAYVASSAGASARLVGFAPGTHTSYGGNFGIEVYGPSGPAAGAVYSTNAGPLLLDSVIDFAEVAPYNVDPYIWPSGTLLDQMAYTPPSGRVGLLAEGQSAVMILSGISPYFLAASAYRIQSGQLQRVVGPVMQIGAPTADGDSAIMYRKSEFALLVDLTRYL